VTNQHLRLTIVITAVIALVLSIVPLPNWLAILRPQFLVLTVLYWSTMMPRVGGLLLGFGSGLALDVFEGSLLGEHALALALASYLAIRLHLLVRAKPIFEQSLFVFAALMVYEFALWVIDGWSGHPLSNPTRWLHTLTGGLVWPLAVGILGRFHSNR
jgi:rod shape-determining protein MreD